MSIIENSVLIADPDISSMTEQVRDLRGEGYEVLEASSSQQAIGLCQDQQPELAIINVELGATPGIELARQLQTHAHTGFLLVSENCDQTIARLAVEEGAMGFLIKPLDSQVLRPAVQATLERVREFRRLRDAEFHLNRALEQSRNVSVAIGLVMERHRLDERAAFELLRSNARSQRRKLADLAKDLISSVEIVNRISSPRS